MKKLFIAALCVSSITSVRSQVYVQGGLNLANISTTSSGQTEDNKTLTTFNAGILSRFGLSHMIDLESGILLSGKGSKAETFFTGSTDDNYIKTKFNPLYIEVPLNLVVKVPLEKTTNVFFYGGPYAAVGIAGKSKTESSIFGLKGTSESDVKFSNDDPSTSQQEDAAYDKLKRFDFGLNVGAGLDLKKVLIKFNYGYGLTKINSTQSNNSADDKNKYRIASVSLGIPLN